MKKANNHFATSTFNIKRPCTNYKEKSKTLMNKLVRNTVLLC